MVPRGVSSSSPFSPALTLFALLSLLVSPLSCFSISLPSSGTSLNDGGGGDGRAGSEGARVKLAPSAPGCGPPPIIRRGKREGEEQAEAVGIGFEDACGRGKLKYGEEGCCVGVDAAEERGPEGREGEREWEDREQATVFGRLRVVMVCCAARPWERRQKVV